MSDLESGFSDSKCTAIVDENINVRELAGQPVHHALRGVICDIELHCENPIRKSTSEILKSIEAARTNNRSPAL